MRLPSLVSMTSLPGHETATATKKSGERNEDLGGVHNGIVRPRTQFTERASRAGKDQRKTRTTMTGRGPKKVGDGGVMWLNFQETAG